MQLLSFFYNLQFFIFKVLVVLSESFHGPLDHNNALQLVIDNAIDCSSFGLNCLIILLLFNWVRLFTFLSEYMVLNYLRTTLN